jgi:hypothetical protein
VHKQSSKHSFATLLWDSLPHGGASQVHPHIHATVHADHYYGEWREGEAKSQDISSRPGQFESLRFASERYFRDSEHLKTFQSKNYFRTIQDIHTALNLTVSLNGLTVLVPIVSCP